MKRRYMERVAPRFITTLASDEIFVFGSNILGLHSGGSLHFLYFLDLAQVDSDIF